MRLVFLILALLLSGQLSYGQQNYFTIEGKLAKKTDYKYIYLNYESTEGSKQDSTLIKNGAFYFKGIPVYGTHAYIQLKGNGAADPDNGNQFDFSIEPVNFKIHVDGNLNKSRIEGSPIDKDLQELERILEPAYLAWEKWYERYDQFKATASQDSIELNKYSIEYQKFKAKNFEILGISLDDETTKEKWLKAIKEDQLDWLQVSDLKGWQSEVAELYHVRGIPQNFLLDPKGVIIATNLRGEKLLKTLEDILGK